MNFFDLISAANAARKIERNQSLLYLNVSPHPELLECGDIQLCRDWLKGAIAQTAGLVCAYQLNLDCYQALGAGGIELLEEIRDAFPPDMPVILDAKHGDVNTSTLFARRVFGEWQMDACTLLPYGGQDQVAPFLVYPDKAVFVLCYTGNASGAVLQEYPSRERPLYLHLVRESKTWGTPEQLGLKVDAAMPDVLARVRSAAPERLIMVLDYSYQQQLSQMLNAGLNSYGEGLLLPVPPDLLLSENPREAIASLGESINTERQRVIQGNPTCELWVPNVCFLQPQPHLDLILQLYDIGCIIFGEHVQASGAILPYYIDLRKMISVPQVFYQIVGAYAQILQGLEFDRIAGIPYGSLPTATGLALRMERPMIFPRKEVKAHGTQRLIEGHYEPGEKVVVVDDILITGNSVLAGAEKLQSVGLEVQDIVVFIDHGGSVKENLQAHGYRGHAVLTLAEIAETLLAAERIDEGQFQLLMAN